MTWRIYICLFGSACSRNKNKQKVLGPALVRNLELCNYTKPTPVQKYSLPIGMAKRDMMACAQTGSGKTAGFLFPVLVSMLRDGAPPAQDEHRHPSGNGYNRGGRKQNPMALILSPTRELTSQIFDEAQKFTYCTGIRSVVIYGGAEVRLQLKELERGCDLLVATPGRLVDLLERGRLGLSSVKFLVLDEADRMLDMGFEPQIRRIVEQEGMGADRQTFMFSATFPREIQRLASDFMKDYIFLAVGRVGSASKDVAQEVMYVEANDKATTLMQFLSTIESGLILVFVETKRSADYLEDMLCREGFPAASIHGDKTQREREGALDAFKRGINPVLVATDVAARGLDIPNVTQVVNYDLPNNIDDYVHRIGRTGRCGNLGHALSFINDKNRNIARELQDLLTEASQTVPEWLGNLVQYTQGGGGRGKGGGGRGKGGHNAKFGARDYRSEGRGGGGAGGGFGGGGGGYGGGGYGGGSGGRSGGGGGFDNSAW
jgi:ATP-dependent RNA helicase DDX3X